MKRTAQQAVKVNASDVPKTSKTSKTSRTPVTPRGINENGIRCIINYRRLKQTEADSRKTDYGKACHEAAKEVFDKDSHSGGSYSWTAAQSRFIDEKGWDAWWKTDGPEGYAVYLKKNWFKD